MNTPFARRLDVPLVLAALLEARAGIVLVVDPAPLLGLLLGVDAAAGGALSGRLLGIALLSLALACWPTSRRAPADAAGRRGLLAYNLMVAFYGTYVVVTRQGGVLLWPAVALHSVVALVLWRSRRGKAPPTVPTP